MEMLGMSNAQHLLDLELWCYPCTLNPSQVGKMPRKGTFMRLSGVAGPFLPCTPLLSFPCLQGDKLMAHPSMSLNLTQE